MPSCCAFAVREYRVAQLLNIHGVRNTAGPLHGTITLSHDSVRQVCLAIDSYLDLGLSQAAWSRRRRFKLGEEWHADLIAVLLDAEPTWGGDWGHICSMLGWYRPDLEKHSDDDDDDPDDDYPRAPDRERELAAWKTIAEDRLRVIDNLKKQLRDERRESLQLKRKLGELETSGATNFKKGKSGRYFSVRGGLLLSLRHCVSRSSCNAMGLCLGMDVHRTTVQRWMIALRQC